jgi:hypothetical protein
LALAQELTKSLPKIDAILVEVSTVSTLKDAPEAKDISPSCTPAISCCATCWEPCGGRSDDMVVQMDLLFVQTDAKVAARS